MSLPLLHAGRTNPGLSAALDLRFALDKSLTAYRGPTPSFSRASTGTYFNASGVLTSAAINAPRFNHTFNGTSWVSRGLLVEEQRTNAFQWSEDFSNAFWTKLNAAIATSSGTSPDGTNTANKITDDSTNGTHRIYRGNVGTADQPCTTSFYLKAGTARYAIVLNSDNNDWRAYAVADLQTGTITQNGVMVAATGASYIGSSITNCGDGWYRVSVSGTNRNGDANYYGQVALSNSATPGTIPSYVGTGSYIYAVMAQMELNSSFPTSYIKTTSSTVTRSADVCQITGGDFSGFWNGTEGTLACEFDRLSPVTAGGQIYPRTFMIGTSGNNFIDHFTNTGSPYQEIFQAYSGGAQQFGFGGYINTGITTQKYALAFASNDSAVSVNGTTAQTDNTCTVPAVTANMSIGYNIQSGSSFINGHIARLRYYRKRLPNATLQLLSEPDPTLNLQFALNKTLTPVAGPAPSFSRASTGTFFNASGVLTSASINTPRFDHVFSGGQWVSRGLLIEEQRTNLLPRSEEFNTGWTNNDINISTNSVTAPDGTLTADNLVPNTVNTNHRLYQGPAGSGVASVSIFAKSTGYNWLQVRVGAGGGTSVTVNFDIVNGAIGDTVLAGGATASGQSIENVGNGWWRCKFTTASVPAFTTVIMPRPDNASVEGQAYAGDGVKGVAVWGAQLENASFPTSYIPTTSSSVTRSADVCQITGTSFNWLWNQGEGSVVAEYDRLAVKSSEQQVFNASTSSGGQQVSYNLHPSNDYAMFWTGSIQAQLNTGSAIQAGVVGKNASSYKINDFAMSFNGGSIVSDTAGVVPIPDRLGLGSDLALGSFYLNGHIAKLVYYPARLTNAKLQQLST